MKRIYEYEDLQPVLEQLLQDKESSDMEFKSAKGGFPHSMWETYSSFANTDGGAIVFGIKEKDEQFFLDGLTEAQVKKDVNVALPDVNVALPDGNVALPDGNVALPGANVALLGANVGLPDSNVGLPDSNVGLTGGNVGLPDSNVGLPGGNVGPRRKRYSKNELRDILVSFCTQWKTAEEIALYVGRDLDYIRDRVLPQMSDVIEKMYDIPHHPRQKYRAKQQMESEE